MVFKVGSIKQYHLRAYNICKTSGPTLHLLNQKLHTNKFSRSYDCTLKCEKHWSREDVATEEREVGVITSC